LVTWNLGTLIGKSIDLIDTIKCRIINLACIQETKWKGEKAKKINGYKLWYVGKDNHRNGVGIVVDKNLKDKVILLKEWVISLF
jgi:exonuclease III